MPEPEFAPGRLADHPASRRTDRGSEGTGRAVVFDPKNPTGRTAHDRLFDAREEDFTARMRAVYRVGALKGAGLFVFAAFVFLPFDWIGTARVALAGGVAGAVAVRWGDSAGGWCAACTLGSALIYTLMPGPPFFVIAGFLGAMGWLIGFVREAS